METSRRKRTLWKVKMSKMTKEYLETVPLKITNVNVSVQKKKIIGSPEDNSLGPATAAKNRERALSSGKSSPCNAWELQVTQNTAPAQPVHPRASGVLQGDPSPSFPRILICLFGHLR